jgi:hypothetical protein
MDFAARAEDAQAGSRSEKIFSQNLLACWRYKLLAQQAGLLGFREIRVQVHKAMERETHVYRLLQMHVMHQVMLARRMKYRCEGLLGA